MSENWKKIRFKSSDLKWEYYPFLFPFINEIFGTKETRILKTIDDFTKAVILLSINVMKADGSIHNAEAKVLRDKLISLFPNLKISQLDYLLKGYYNRFKGYESSEIFTFSVEVIPDYINQQIRDKEIKDQLCYFLCEIAFADNVFKNEEKKMLIKLARSLGLTDMDIARLFAFFEGRVSEINFSDKHRWEIPKKDTKKKEYKTQSKKKTRIYVPSNNQYSYHSALIILGVNKNTSSDQIKRAYKKLAMQYHPDRFINQSKAQIEIATERFIKIQSAYELVKKIKRFT